MIVFLRKVIFTSADSELGLKTVYGSVNYGFVNLDKFDCKFPHKLRKFRNLRRKSFTK